MQKALEEETEAFYQRRLSAALAYLDDRLNSTGDVHTNFHGMAKACNICL